MVPKTFFVIGGHCPRSKEDAQTIYNYFLQNGLKPVRTIQKADIVCIYTCGGFDDTERSSIKTIQRILENKSKNALVIVTGCLTKINPKSMDELDGIVLIEFDKLDQLDKLISPELPFTQVPNAGVVGKIPPLDNDKDFLERLTNTKYLKNSPQYLKYYLSRIGKKNLNIEDIYHVRISRGCLGSCSYCSIKLAHGQLRSKPIDQVKKDFEEGLKKGHHIFKLIGQDTGSYGIDIDTNIVEVLKIFFDFPGDNKIIITDFNPRWFIKYYDLLEPLLQTNYKRILSFRIPVESGSDKILKRMKRPYQIEEVKKYLLLIKEKIPDLNLFTHIIVGFPGETEEDFSQTLAFIKEVPFDSVGVFSYSDRPMTEAYKMEGKLPSKTIQKRVKQIKKQISIIE